MTDSYRNRQGHTQLIHLQCNRAAFSEIARAHHWRESVIAILVRNPFRGEFQMGAYWLKLVA